jgi:Ca2+-binding EF-hand superfamily protein
MLDTFSKIDGGGIGRDEKDDRRIDYTEWMKEYSRLIGSGFLGLRNMTDADIANSVFQTMDGDNKGMVLFTEFCEYVTSYEVENKTKMGKLFGGKLKVVHKKADDKSTGTSVVTDGAEIEVKAPLLIGDVYSYSPEAYTTSTELYRFLESFVEFSENSSEGKEKRHSAFTTADPNGNGYCSLAELESFILVALQKGFSKEESNALFRLFRPCFIRAFTSSKTFAQDHTENDDDFVQSSEFRKFVLFLCIYAVMYDAFTQLDGTKENDEDMKVNKEEFLQGYQNLKKYGFFALNSLSSNEEATFFFDEMRAEANAVVFSEWCSHLVRIEKENNTTLGGAF